MQFCDPQTNVLQLGLREGMKVADLGAGAGHFALAAAPIVSPGGHVYAVDVQEDVLKHLKYVAQAKGIRNIDTVWGNVERLGGIRLRDHSVDAVMLGNTLFQLEHKEGALAEIKRVLRPGGKVLIVDWAACYDGMGPSEDLVVPEHVAEKLFMDAGFHKQKGFRGGPHHYSLVMSLPAL